MSPVHSGSFMQEGGQALCPFPVALCPCSLFAERPFNLRSVSPFSISETSLPPAFLRGDSAISVASVLNEGYFCFPPRLNLRTGSASFC